MDPALSIQGGISQEELARLIQKAAQLTGVSAQDMPRFEADIKKSREYDSLELRADVVSKVIEEWRGEAKARLGQQELPVQPWANILAAPRSAMHRKGIPFEQPVDITKTGSAA